MGIEDHYIFSVEDENSAPGTSTTTREYHAMSKKTKLKPYPNWVCCDCGRAASGGRQFSMSTYHNGFCNVCEQDEAVTEPRDFYYPEFKGHEALMQSNDETIQNIFNNHGN